MKNKQSKNNNRNTEIANEFGARSSMNQERSSRNYFRKSNNKSSNKNKCKSK